MGYTSGDVLTAAELNTFTPSAKIENAIGSAASPSYTFTGDTNTGISAATGDKLAFSTAGSQRVTIDASGNVGIGTTSPGAPLQIDHATSAALRLNDTGGTVGAAIASTVQFFAGGAQNGSVGYASGVGILQLLNNDGPIYIQTDAADDVSLRTNGNTRMTVKSTGKVGIGTTAPAELLHVGDASTAGTFRVHATAGVNSFRISGTNAISTTIKDATTALAGNMYISTGGYMYRSTSSIKYKSPVEDLEDDYADRVLEMRPVWYRSITGNDPTGFSYYGLIAEEVAAIDPRLVSFGPLADCVCPDDPDDPGVTVHTPECLTEPEGVQYDRLIPHLISVAQRQADELAALTARLEALESPA